MLYELPCFGHLTTLDALTFWVLGMWGWVTLVFPLYCVYNRRHFWISIQCDNLILLRLTRSVPYVTVSLIPLAGSLVAHEEVFIFSPIFQIVTRVDGQLRNYFTEIKIQFSVLTLCWKSCENTISCTQSWLIMALIYCEFLKVGLQAKTFMFWWSVLHNGRSWVQLPFY